MSGNRADPARRRLVRATTALGGAGIVVAATPFVASLAPGERARAASAPVTVNVMDSAPGELRTVEWQGKPVWVLQRTPAMIEQALRATPLLADPASKRSEQPPYARNALRSIRPEFAVLVAVCTHLGCIPTFRPEAGAADLGASWPGGFFCPCHGSKFDLAGRVFRNVPAPTNLPVPSHRFEADDTLVVGPAFG